MTRTPNPPPDPVVERLRKAGSDNESEDVLALVGYVGPGRPGHLRMHPDRDLRRWLEIPEGDILDSARVNLDDPLGGRTMVWVNRDAMQLPLFSDNVLAALEAEFEHGAMSTWPLIPDSLQVAAEILDLLVRRPDREAEEGGYT